MPDRVLTINLRRSVGCAAFLVTLLLMLAAVALGNGAGSSSLEAVLLIGSVAVCILLALVVVGWKRRVLLDAETRSAQARTTVFGLPVRTQRTQFSSDDVVLVACATRQHEPSFERPQGRSWTWQRRTVRVGQVVLVDDSWDETHQALAVAWRVARHLGMAVVEERDGQRRTLEPPVAAGRLQELSAIPLAPPGLEVEETADGEVVVRWQAASRRGAALVVAGTILAWALVTLGLVTQGVDLLGMDAVVPQKPSYVFAGDGVLGFPALLFVPGLLVAAWLGTRRFEVRGSTNGVAALRRSAIRLSGIVVPAAQFQDVVAQGGALTVRGDTQILTLDRGLNAEQAGWIAARMRGLAHAGAAGSVVVPGFASRRMRTVGAVSVAVLLAASVVVVEFDFVGLWLRRSEPVKQALALAAKRPEVREAVGEPMVVGRWLHGGVDPFGTWRRAVVDIPVSGPRGTATIAFSAQNDPYGSGHWTIRDMRLWVGSEAQVLVKAGE